jgi:hypothetical protein
MPYEEEADMAVSARNENETPNMSNEQICQRTWQILCGAHRADLVRGRLPEASKRISAGSPVMKMGDKGNALVYTQYSKIGACHVDESRFHHETGTGAAR